MDILQKGLLGYRKKVPTTEAEQRKLKKAFMQVFPDNLFIDNLYDKNIDAKKEGSKKGVALKAPVTGYSSNRVSVGVSYKFSF